MLAGIKVGNIYIVVVEVVVVSSSSSSNVLVVVICKLCILKTMLLYYCQGFDKRKLSSSVVPKSTTTSREPSKPMNPMDEMKMHHFIQTISNSWSKIHANIKTVSLFENEKNRVRLPSD